MGDAPYMLYQMTITNVRQPQGKVEVACGRRQQLECGIAPSSPLHRDVFSYRVEQRIWVELGKILHAP